MSVEQSLKAFEESKSQVMPWFTQEISSLRSGRVKPDLLSSIMVDHYGSRNQLQALASVSSLDARTLLISPWDKSAVVAIEKAITQANLGAMPVVDGQTIRLSFPSLTQDVRETTIKQLHKKAEEARVRLRVGRDEALKGLKGEKEEGKISEDDFYKGREKLDTAITAANDDIGALVKKKEEEISTI